MIRVFVVDDEKLVRRGIIGLIDWEKYYSFVPAARTACIYYHAQSSLSTICNRFYRNFCTNLSNKLAPWKNRPEINVPERFFLELVTGVEPATH